MKMFRKTIVQRYHNWFNIIQEYYSNYLLLTERVKSPGFPLDGLARKLPSTPLLISRCSASTPWMLGWNQRLEDILTRSLTTEIVN